MGNVTPQTVLAGNPVTTAFTLGGGNWARRWGRQQPAHGDSARIIGEVRENVYASDINGLAYGADTLWVRCFNPASTGSAGEDELDQTNWMGVPATLPAGYTVRNARNIMPASGWAGGSDIWTTANPHNGAEISPFYPSTGSPSLLVRSEGGIYAPLANDGLQLWGPWNAGNKHVRYHTSLGEPPPNANTDRPVLQSIPGIFDAGATSLTGSTSMSGVMRTPGFRSVGVYFQMFEDWYNGTASVPQFASLALTITLGSASVSTTILRADTSFFGPPTNTYVVNKGNIGALIPAVGEVPLIDVAFTLSFSAAPIRSSASAMGLYLYLAPRVDIPLPFTCTGPGNLVAPGGILTGSIPGF